jgi:hypothetical protein
VYSHQSKSMWLKWYMKVPKTKCGKTEHYMNSIHLYHILILDISYCRNTRASAVGLGTLWNSERVSNDTKRVKWAFQKETLLLNCGINDLISPVRSLILIHNELELCSQRTVEPIHLSEDLGTIHSNQADCSGNKAHPSLNYLMA